MPSLTTQQRADFDRTAYPAVGLVYICQPELVFEAPLEGVFYSNDAIVALDYGTPTTGAYTDIEPEMTVEIWDADSNAYGSQRVRKAATTGAIFVGRSPEGTRPGELSFDSNTTVRVYKERRVWAKNPFIDTAGTQYKDELAYPGDNAAQPPVANAGPDKLIISTTGAELVALDALGSVPSFAVRNGATLASYQWSLDGGIIDTGTLTSSSLTASFGYGEHYVALTVTDNNGVSHTCYKLIVVARASECIPVTINRESVKRSGVELQLTIDAYDLPVAARPNAKVLYMQYDTHGTYGNGTLAFSGWIAPEDWALEDARRQKNSITITCHDVGRRLNSLFGFPLTVSNEASATGWYKMPNATIDRMTHHYLQWHTNALSVTDFSWSGQGGTYPLPQLTTTGLSIFQQGDRLAQAISYRMTCKRNGALQMVGDPLELPTSQQAADFATPTQRTSTEITTLNPADYGRYNFTANQTTQYYWLRGQAVVASDIPGNISAVKCSAPGKTPAQGVSSQEASELLVTSQDELNVRMGNRYVTRVNPAFSPFTFNLVKSAPVWEVADMEWVRGILPDKARERYPFLKAEGNRFLIDEVINTYNHRKARRSTTLTATIEVEGIPAQTIVDPPPQAEVYPEWEDTYVPIYVDTQYGSVQSGLVRGVGNMALIMDDGTVAVTTDFSTPSWEGGPTWVIYDHTATIGSTVIQYAFRPLATNISAWLVTPTSLWYAENLQSASPTFTEQITFAASTNARNVDADFINAPGQFAAVFSDYGSDQRLTVTTNGGTTWGSEAVVASRGSSNRFMSGLSISPHVAGRVFLGTYAGETIDAIGSGFAAFIRQSNDFGTTFSKLSNIYADDVLMSGLLIPFAGDGRYGYFNAPGLFSDVLPAFEDENNLMRAEFPNVGFTRISPQVDGVYYGPDWLLGRFTTSVADNDVNKVALCGIDLARSKRGVWVTPNALSDSPTWINPVPPEIGIPYTRCALVNNGTELYIFGEDGNIAYSPNPYQTGTFNNRIGNLASLTPGNVIGIAGF